MFPGSTYTYKKLLTLYLVNSGSVSGRLHLRHRSNQSQSPTPFNTSFPIWDRLLHAALSENTHRAYQAGFNSYHYFCTQYGHNCIWPPSLESVVQFVAYLSAKGLSYATVRSYLAGLSYFTKLQGFQDPTDQFLVSKLLQGTNHTHDSRLPITES